ncbi:GNAT family N-acetyltransferase [Aliirhizobium smilacinae]|uniref:GNAT family N-acetyltransferase n=1 Tax=Aliirhizobium smilacinae TaxID=1395944 RepID=A0A5C4XPM7_9HYPH|nr:GNAT family N-acetyltransferase [Rhizobium smilacinae]TNM65248.1 GNAT family N-acetyltransferase [Rhizobium smilacinae]
MTLTDESYSIESQTPDVETYLRLRTISGLTPFAREAAETGLKGTLYSVIVRHCGVAVGMGRLVGDGGCFFQVTDIAVDPVHQGRGLGKAIMSSIMSYVERTLPATAYVSLIADVPANKLYEQFGFKPTAPKSVGMSFLVKR